MADSASTTSNGTGLDPKVSGLLSWLLGGTVIVPAVLFFIEKDKFAKFHALQSLIWSIAAGVIAGVLYFIITIVTFGIGSLCLPIIFLPVIVNILGAIKAYNGEMWKLPVIGDFAEQQSGK